MTLFALRIFVPFLIILNTILHIQQENILLVFFLSLKNIYLIKVHIKGEEAGDDGGEQ